ncbi:protein ALTERED PHOSPHATE STARVATION RESPONSE 1 [Aristolochia californica]|uniref:protein ALTERED PHOSPHATE STARVATION RESPONSE 1 n=1 Tax=Aristolochia californica TaxID=171875 RepID=UPI0035D7A324
MGTVNSKSEKDKALLLCKRRKKFTQQAIESRYALSAAHLSYIQSLRDVGVALRRFAEAEIFIESSLSTSATELDRTPSHSTYPSPSPSHNAEIVDSPLHNESPASTPLSTVSYMRSSGPATVTVRMDSSLNRFAEDESLTFPVPPPPPPPETGSSWDFFYPTSSIENGYKQNFDNLMNLRQFREEDIHHITEEEADQWEKVDVKCKDGTPKGTRRWDSELKLDKSPEQLAVHSRSNGEILVSSSSSEFSLNRFLDSDQNRVQEAKRPVFDNSTGESEELLVAPSSSKQWGSIREETGTEQAFPPEREDPSEFITHRAKDFLASVKDIEHRFFRASESGREVSRMLEASKIQLSFSESRGKSSATMFQTACHLICCSSETAPLPHEQTQSVTKVITWKRSTSYQSSSSRNPLVLASRDDDDSGSDFIEEFCMIAGSHSSTLDRLYAWERKLHDEVKASESIRKEYDRKCELLRHQFAKDLKPQTIDKTRSIVKDLYSQIKVTIQAIESISKRIEKLRDEELLPQLLELIQGFIRMWKAMIECHHAQYITISLAYHGRSSSSASQSEIQREALCQLQHEMECFHSNLGNCYRSHKSYVQALNSWLQNCISKTQERSRRWMPFSPPRTLQPPIFVLFHEWLSGIDGLPYSELCEAINGLLSVLRGSFELQVEEEKKLVPNEQKEETEEIETGDEKVSNLNRLQSSLTGALDRLTKFAEASLKMYEDIRQRTEAARVAYTNCRTRL